MSGSIAAFDFDGTLTARDTIVPFIRAAVGDMVIARRLPLALPVVCARGLGLVGATFTKERLFGIYLRGRSVDEVREAGRRFAREKVPPMLRPEAIRRLRWHRGRGDRCVVVTASPELYVAPWADGEGVETLGSRLELDAQGRLTGRHEGLACDGTEKARRLRELIGAVPANLYAYGDSRGDLELLKMARFSYWRVMPDSEEP